MTVTISYLGLCFLLKSPEPFHGLKIAFWWGVHPYESLLQKTKYSVLWSRHSMQLLLSLICEEQ